MSLCRLSLIVGLLLGGAGCSPVLPDGVFACTETSDCPTHQICSTNHFCRTPNALNEPAANSGEPHAMRDEPQLGEPAPPSAGATAAPDPAGSPALLNAGAGSTPTASTAGTAASMLVGSAGMTGGAPSSGGAGQTPAQATAGMPGANTVMRLASGRSCKGNAECESNACVDHVCCAATSCGICESCTSGKCEPIRGDIDVDNCQGEKICNNEHRCLTADLNGCNVNEDCVSNNCLNSKCRAFGVHCEESMCPICHTCKTTADQACSPIVGPDMKGSCNSGRTCSSDSKCYYIDEQASVRTSNVVDPYLDTRSYAQVIRFQSTGQLEEISVELGCFDANLTPVNDRMPPVWIEGVGTDGKPNGSRLSNTTVVYEAPSGTNVFNGARLTTPFKISPNMRIALVVGKSTDCLVVANLHTTYSNGSMLYRDDNGSWTVSTDGSLIFQTLVSR